MACLCNGSPSESSESCTDQAADENHPYAATPTLVFAVFCIRTKDATKQRGNARTLIGNGDNLPNL